MSPWRRPSPGFRTNVKTMRAPNGEDAPRWVRQFRPAHVSTARPNKHEALLDLPQRPSALKASRRSRRATRPGFHQVRESAGKGDGLNRMDASGGEDEIRTHETLLRSTPLAGDRGRFSVISNIPETSTAYIPTARSRFEAFHEFFAGSAFVPALLRWLSQLA